MFTIQTKQKEDLVREQIEIISTLGDASVQQLINNHKTTYDLFWNNEFCTPQEICDKLGSEAYKLFINSKTTQDYISSVQPDYVQLTVPEIYDVVFNEDGTVSITNK